MSYIKKSVERLRMTCQRVENKVLGAKVAANCGGSGLFTILKCLFIALNPPALHGGAIEIAGSSSLNEICDCTFRYCTSTRHGGAIYEEISKKSVHRRNCFIGCSLIQGTYGLASYSSLKPTANLEMEMISAAECNVEDEMGRLVIAIFGGVSLNTYMNVSRCSMQRYTTLAHIGSLSFVDKFNTHAENNLSIIIHLNSAHEGSIEYNNFIGNNEPASRHAMIYDDLKVSSVSVEKCVIIGNSYNTIRSHLGITFSFCLLFSNNFKTPKEGDPVDDLYQPSTLGYLYLDNSHCMRNQVETLRFSPSSSLNSSQIKNLQLFFLLLQK